MAILDQDLRRREMYIQRAQRMTSTCWTDDFCNFRLMRCSPML